MKELIVYSLLAISLILIGNVWCYFENQRLLHPMTNVCFMLAAVNFLIPKYFHVKRKRGN